MADAPQNPDPFRRLVEIMALLRHPADGCPWDLEQDFRSIAPHTIEEAYEVVDAIERDDLQALRDELGDLLLQVVYHARMAEEAGAFSVDGVAEAICNKLVRRHPNVFGDAHTPDAAAQTQAWEAQKADERRAAAGGDGRHSVLDGIATALPAATRALKLQARASRVGFDWQEPADILDKLEEEIGEIRAELASGDRNRLLDEIGDLLFVGVNLARKAGVDPESALRSTNQKFERRFRFVEQSLEKEGKTFAVAGLDGMESLWQRAKRAERGTS
ncbi:MAG: nucleoside triphosphate pyrophosphohydrolase [Acetobacterales bacterium]